MLLKLYQAGQPILRQTAQLLTKTQLATKHTQSLIDLMIATLRDAPGVGLAAPQVGELLRIIILEDKATYHEQVSPDVLAEQGRKPVKLKVIVNPEIAYVDTVTATFFEGCLSVDGYTAAVERHKQVRVTGLDRQGKPISFVAHDWLARMVQHEVDHLNGLLYIDAMRPSSFMTLKNFSLLRRKSSQQDIERAYPSVEGASPDSLLATK